MKKFGANKILGLAIGERSILIAEVSIADGQRQISRAGEFVYPAGVTLQDSLPLGTALAAYLKREGFSAKAAVFGIPAKWVLTKSKELPPVDPSLAAGMLRLQVESEFSSELKDLVYDYAGQTHASQASHVLLAATPRRHVEQLSVLAEAARLDIRAITPTSLVLSAATAGVSDALVLSITPSGTELAAQRGSSPSLLRHVGSTMAVTASVAGEVRRAAMMLPRNGTTAGSGNGANGATNGHSHGQVVVWDDAGLDLAARRAVTEALGPHARSGDFAMLGAGDLPQGVQAGAGAVALAVAGLTEGAIPVDFQHPRLAEPKKSALPRPVVLGIAAAVVIVLTIIMAYVNLNHMENQRDALQDKIAGEKESVNNQPSQVEAARKEIERNKFAANWHTGKPRYVACFTDLTNAIPFVVRERPKIFIFGLTLDENMKGEIHGRAVDKDSANALYDILNKSPRFRNVSADRAKENSNPETKAEFPYTFTISFNYVPLPG
ncbi:MAG TPA: hypothetical protein VFE47_28725 [Tepidisphaeraceae bacterium]|jgi:hypothetical protein|nr:hypothetical protein [Tepidisphaeraceae bacterium]